VELNRAVALAMAFGPAVGLELVDSLVSEGSLEGYHLLPSVRGDLLAKLDRFDEARTEFERAASLTRNTRERELILERATACRRGPGGPLGDHARLARGAFSPNRARSSHASRG
jgi:predicted RNA polymerase sigma factor